MEYLQRTRKKCCFVGDFGVGKTSIIFSYLSKSIEDIQTTLGIDFFSKTIRIKEQDLHLTIWDTAGSERFRSLLHSYLRDSDIIIIVYDLSKQNLRAAVLSRVDTVNWLVNMRGGDLPCTPVNLCFAFFEK